MLYFIYAIDCPQFTLYEVYILKTLSVLELAKNIRKSKQGCHERNPMRCIEKASIKKNLFFGSAFPMAWTDTTTFSFIQPSIENAESSKSEKRTVEYVRLPTQPYIYLSVCTSDDRSEPSYICDTSLALFCQET